jgi:hypothetical protein
MANEYSLFNLKIIFGKLLFRIISSVIEPANGSVQRWQITFSLATERFDHPLQPNSYTAVSYDTFL